VRALILGYQGDWAASAEACQDVVERAHSAGLDYEVALCSHHAGVALLESGEFARAYAALQFALEGAEQIASDRLCNLNRMLLAYLDGINGDPKAHRVLGELLTYAEEEKLAPDVITGRYLLGKLLLADGDLDAARRELEMARRLAQQADNHRLAEGAARMLSSLRPPPA
jgi:ATP/maltotriose-dependent transcriptional regulator MalT